MLLRLVVILGKDMQNPTQKDPRLVQTAMIATSGHVWKENGELCSFNVLPSKYSLSAVAVTSIPGLSGVVALLSPFREL
jgi:hypothetical protein